MPTVFIDFIPLLVVLSDRKQLSQVQDLFYFLILNGDGEKYPANSHPTQFNPTEVSSVMRMFNVLRKINTPKTHHSNKYHIL